MKRCRWLFVNALIAQLGEALSPAQSSSSAGSPSPYQLVGQFGLGGFSGGTF